MLGKIVSSFMMIVIGIAMFGTITTQLNKTINSMNVSLDNQASGTLLKTLPGFFAFSMVLGGLVMMFNALKDAGIIPGGEDEFESSSVFRSKDEEIVDALQEGEEDEVRENRKRELKSPKKTKYDIHADNIQKDIEGYKQRAGEIPDTELESVNYHGSNKEKKRVEKESDPYLEEFDNSKFEKEDKFTKKGKFD